MNSTFTSSTNFTTLQYTDYDDFPMLEDARYIPLVVLGTISSSLSIVGSSCIVCMSAPKLRNEIKQRLLFCLSSADILLSASLLMMPFTIPSSLGLRGAVGTHTTCTVFGFVGAITGPISIYCNAYLSVYFLLLVKYNWKEHDFTPRLELLAHSIPLCLILSTSIAGVVTQSFNPTPLFDQACTYAAAPWGCGRSVEEGGSGVECQRSSFEMVRILLVISSIPMSWIVSLVGFVCTGMVWCTVRTTFRKNRTYNFERSVQHNSYSQSKAAAANNFSNSIRSTTTSTRTTTTRRGYPRTAVDPNEERIKEVGIQAVQYSLAYFNALFWPLVVTVFIESYNELEVATTLKLDPGVYALQLLFWTFLPLQGLFNFLVYTRAKRCAWRKAEPNASILWIYKQIVAGATVPPPNRNSSGIVSGATLMHTSRTAAGGILPHHHNRLLSTTNKSFQEQDENEDEEIGTEQNHRHQQKQQPTVDLPSFSTKSTTPAEKEGLIPKITPQNDEDHDQSNSQSMTHPLPLDGDESPQSTEEFATA